MGLGGSGGRGQHPSLGQGRAPWARTRNTNRGTSHREETQGQVLPVCGHAVLVLPNVPALSGLSSCLLSTTPPQHILGSLTDVFVAHVKDERACEKM